MLSWCASGRTCGPGAPSVEQAPGFDGGGELLHLRGVGFRSGFGHSLRPAVGWWSSGIQITVATGLSEDGCHKPCGWWGPWNQGGKEVVTKKTEREAEVEDVAETEDPLSCLSYVFVFYKAPGLPVLSL